MHRLMRLWKTAALPFIMSLVSGMIRILSPNVPSATWSSYPRWLRRSFIRLGLVRLVPIRGAETGLLLETIHLAKGIDPVADAFAGADVRSDVYAMRDYESVVFIIYIGVGTTGTSTILVNSCDNITPDTRTPIPYFSRDILTTDVQSVITARSAAGYIPTAGSSKIILIEVRAQDLVAGDAFVEIEFDEAANAAVLGGVLALFAHGRYKEDVTPTVLA